MTSPAPTSQPPIYPPISGPDRQPAPGAEYLPAPLPVPALVTVSSRKTLFEDTESAKVTRAILRPIIKLFYYLIRVIRSHKWLTLLAILLLIASISLTSFFSTGLWPLGIGNTRYAEIESVAGPRVASWLEAVRTGDASFVDLLQQEIPATSRFAAQDIIAAFGENEAHIKWDSLALVGQSRTDDTMQHTFIQINYTISSGNTEIKSSAIWYFYTYTIPTRDGQLALVQLVSNSRVS